MNLPTKVYDLSQPYYVGMPHHPVHPPYLFGLVKKHGDAILENGASSASEALTLGGHVGTHIDALAHFSCDGKLHGGIEPTQSYGTGVNQHSVDTIAPIFRPGTLFDIAALEGVDALPEDFVITPEHLTACNVEPHAGGIALIRTGWARFWVMRSVWTGGHGALVRGPGPAEPAARWRATLASSPQARIPSRSSWFHPTWTYTFICWWRKAFISSSA